MKIKAFVVEGRIVSIYQPHIVNDALGRDLDWEEFENPDDDDPNKTYYRADVLEHEYPIAVKAIQDFMDDLEAPG